MARTTANELSFRAWTTSAHSTWRWRSRSSASACAASCSGVSGMGSGRFSIAGSSSSGLRNRQDVRERIDELAGKRHGRIAVQQVTNGIGTGRPTLYRPELCEMARRLAMLGPTDAEIADALNIAVITLSRWKQNYSEFRQAIARGGAQADAKVADRLYVRAFGYEHRAVKIFHHPDTGPVQVPYVEHYPPDTKAALAWLSRRQPEKWRERRPDCADDGGGKSSGRARAGRAGQAAARRGKADN